MICMIIKTESKYSQTMLVFPAQFFKVNISYFLSFVGNYFGCLFIIVPELFWHVKDVGVSGYQKKKRSKLIWKSVYQHFPEQIERYCIRQITQLFLTARLMQMHRYVEFCCPRLGNLRQGMSPPPWQTKGQGLLSIFSRTPVALMGFNNFRGSFVSSCEAGIIAVSWQYRHRLVTFSSVLTLSFIFMKLQVLWRSLLWLNVLLPLSELPL